MIIHFHKNKIVFTIRFDLEFNHLFSSIQILKTSLAISLLSNFHTTSKIGLLTPKSPNVKYFVFLIISFPTTQSVWLGCPNNSVQDLVICGFLSTFNIDYSHFLPITSLFTIIEELIIRNKGLDSWQTRMNNGQISCLRSHFLMQSLINKGFKEGDFFVGQKNIPIHKSSFSPLNIKKNTTTTMNHLTRRNKGCQEGLSAIPITDL